LKKEKDFFLYTFRSYQEGHRPNETRGKETLRRASVAWTFNGGACIRMDPSTKRRLQAPPYLNL